MYFGYYKAYIDYCKSELESATGNSVKARSTKKADYFYITVAGDILRLDSPKVTSETVDIVVSEMFRTVEEILDNY